MVDVNRLKKDGKTKYVKLLGKGILTLVEHLFWNLPFCSVNQSRAPAGHVSHILVIWVTPSKPLQFHAIAGKMQRY